MLAQFSRDSSSDQSIWTWHKIIVNIYLKTLLRRELDGIR